RQKLEKVPRLPLDILDAAMAQRARDYLRRVGYNGPTALSCNDTKLHPVLHLYWHKQEQTYLLVGGCDGPIPVANPDELSAMLNSICLWCLQIPLPHIPPLILGAKPIPNTLSVPNLHAMLKAILDALAGQDIYISSYACDG
ncbi:hypothetical protein DAEQUDRAFT_653688, partial [Daedalea quercina L-15889]